MRPRQFLAVVLFIQQVCLLASCDTTPCKPLPPPTVNYSAYSERTDSVTVESRYLDSPQMTLSQIIDIEARDSAAENSIYNVFDSSINFWQDTFANSASIQFSTFKNRADFSYTRFDSDALFMNNIIQILGMRGTHVSRDLDFTSTQFRQIAWFNQLEFGDTGVVYFNDATLPDTLVFSDIQKIPHEIDLTVANYKDSDRLDCNNAYRKHNILLYHLNYSKFHLPYRYFHLIFDDPDPEHKIHITGDDRNAVYEGMLKNFKDRGQSESYRLLDLEYQQYKWGKPYFHRLWWLPKYWWNYGYDKEYVFFWTAFFLLLFTSLNCLCLDCLNRDVYEVPFLTAQLEKGEKYKLFWHSFLYTAFIFFRLTIDFERLKFRKIGYTLYILVINIIGIVCLAYLANFVIQK